MSADPDKPCPHEQFTSRVGVARLTQGEGQAVAAYVAEVQIACSDCDEPFRFIGVQAGLQHDRPMCSVDETELRAPIRPASSDPDFGLGIPGFAINFRAPGEA